MPSLFAHSERKCKSNVRKFRRGNIPASGYAYDMKLRINQLRKERGLTVEELASRAGISKSYLSEMANGKKPINSYRLDAVARALKCSPLDLIDDSSIEPDLFRHMEQLKKLSEEDQRAVLRHADVLAMKDEPTG